MGNVYSLFLIRQYPEPGGLRIFLMIVPSWLIESNFIVCYRFYPPSFSAPVRRVILDVVHSVCSSLRF